MVEIKKERITNLAKLTPTRIRTYLKKLGYIKDGSLTDKGHFAEKIFGYELSLACDIRIAAESAQFGSPEARVSSSITGGALRLLQDIVGLGKAKELLFTCEYIDGKEAARIRLANKTVPDAQLMAETLTMAQKIAENSIFSINLIKKGLTMAGEVSLEALMDYEVEACLATVSAPERLTKLEEFQDRKK